LEVPARFPVWEVRPRGEVGGGTFKKGQVKGVKKRVRKTGQLLKYGSRRNKLIRGKRRVVK